MPKGAIDRRHEPLHFLNQTTEDDKPITAHPCWPLVNVLGDIARRVAEQQTASQKVSPDAAA